MEIPAKPYKIILPQGEAERSFFDLTEKEQLEIGAEIFELVKKLAVEIGEEPAVIKHSARRLHKGI